MTKTKTKKKEEVIDFTKPEKITDKQLEKVQTLINDINKCQIEIGQIETRKHAIVHHISTLQESVGVIRLEFEEEYGTADVNIQDGVINYPKENGEVNS
jgi:hypothetical protein